MAGKYIPDAGDIVWLHFDPQLGHEQRGHRPALVLSPAKYNLKTGLMICCPMTSKIKGFPFEVIVQDSPPSAVLADQIKSLDYGQRKAALKGKVAAAVIQDVRAKIFALIGLP